MNPQPNSHDHPGVVEVMVRLHDAQESLDDFRKGKKHPENFGTTVYETSLVQTVRELQAELERLCAYYSIEIVSS